MLSESLMGELREEFEEKIEEQEQRMEVQDTKLKAQEKKMEEVVSEGENNFFIIHDHNKTHFF